jgi:hypothetical protein
MQIIASLPLLSEFEITRNGDNAYPPLHYLKKNIKKLSVFGRPGDSIPGIAKAIANNPGLECLDLSSGEWRYPRAMPDLHDYFTDSPHPPPHKLRHLGLSGIRLRLDERTIPLFRSLTSFEWVNINRTNNASAEDVWRTLKSEEEIRFSRLKTSSMNDSLLDFLSSSSSKGGMTDIRLEYLAEVNDEDSDRLARIFFQDVLPRHSDTLETLHINASYEGYWVQFFFLISFLWFKLTILFYIVLWETQRHLYLELHETQRAQSICTLASRSRTLKWRTYR